MSDEQQSNLKPCPLVHHVSAGLRVNKTDPKILCLDCGLTLAATDWTTLYERWNSRSDLAPVAQPPEQLQQAAAAIKQLYWDKDIDEANYQVEAILSKHFPAASLQPPSPQPEEMAEEIARRWIEQDLPPEASLHSLSLLQLQALAEHVISKRIASALTSAQSRGSELQPNKAINLLTALEHQAHRNHEYHPSNCGECAMTEQITTKLREQLGLEIRAAKQQ